MRISDWSSDVCSSDLHREPGNRPARQTPPGARPNRDLMTLPASGPGRLLERSGDAAPRGMTVQDRTRLIGRLRPKNRRSEEHTSELQSLMRISYTVFCLKKKKDYHLLPKSARKKQ